MSLKYLLILSVSIIGLSFAGCKDDDFEPKEVDSETDTNFTIPIYADNYSSIASWADRNEWNLANKHN